MTKSNIDNLKKIANELDAFEIFRQAPIAICIFKGNDYTLEFANNFYLQILGRDKSIIGQSIFISFPELEKQGLKEIIDGVIENETPFIINDHEMYLNIDNKNVQSFFNCVYQPLEDSNGSVTRTIVTFTNVTEQVLAKNKNHAYQQSLYNELAIANIELAHQKEEKGKRAAELGLANKELVFQDGEKEKRAAELGIANIELAFQDGEKEKRAAELGIANIELAFQDEEKEKRAAELVVANKELIFQNE